MARVIRLVRLTGSISRARMIIEVVRKVDWDEITKVLCAWLGL